MMKFNTVDGGEYEVEGKKVRMLHEAALDRNWRTFKVMSPAVKGLPVMFVWSIEQGEDGKPMACGSTTGIVCKVEGSTGLESTEMEPDELEYNHTNPSN